MIGSKDHPLEIKFEFYLKGGQRPDLDNLITAALDLLGKAKVISNDKWVESFDGSRRYYKAKHGKPIEEEYTIAEINFYQRD